MNPVQSVSNGACVCRGRACRRGRRPALVALALGALALLLAACETASSSGADTGGPPPGGDTYSDDLGSWPPDGGRGDVARGDAACVANCVHRECGSDGCGGSCGSCAAEESCSEYGECVALPDDCSALPATGECSPQNEAIYCDNGAPRVVTCQPGETCGLDAVAGHMACLTDGSCVPSCTGRACGPDGCGGLCGHCQPGQRCLDGQCSGTVCTPEDCAGRECGDNGCGGSCGTCAAGEACSASGLCVPSGPCEPDCTGRVCGGDGCGGSCGNCGPRDTCVEATGQCVPPGCTPDCTGRQCGPDGCGGRCGLCAGSQTCDEGGHCVAVAPTGCPDVPVAGRCDGATLLLCEDGAVVAEPCAPLVCGYDDALRRYGCVPPECTPACAARECGPDGCGGLCGTCPVGQVCDGAGQCAAPGEGECGDITTLGECQGDTLVYCDDDDTLVTVNCAVYGLVCGPATDAAGEPTGWNDCTLPPACEPQCAASGACGPDGCGGSCGTCLPGETCDATGRCAVTDPCADMPAGGECAGSLLRYCTASGLVTLDCADFDEECVVDAVTGGANCQAPCTPNCTGRQCGADGCGGLCGTCPAGTSCTAAGLCEAPLCAGYAGSDTECCRTNDPCGWAVDDYCDCEGLCPWDGVDCGCQPQCAGRECGADGCGGVCGTCFAGTLCDAAGQCVDPCDVLPPEGVCEGNTLKFCDDGGYFEFDCTEYDATCQFDAAHGYYDCD